MSRAYKCDRCGSYFDPGDQGEIKNNVYDVRVGNEIKDICPKCRDDLYHWYKLRKGYRDGRADAIKDLYPGSDELTEKIREAIVKADPTGKVEFRVVRHGEWQGGWDYECSVCGMDAEYKTRFCPNCGAEMDGEWEESP